MNAKDIGRELNQITQELTDIDNRLLELKKRRQELQIRKQKLEHSLKLNSESREITNDFNGEDFPWSLDLRRVLKSTFKMDDFRDFQLATINATLSNEDVILIMSTGGGKSLCYQLPALIAQKGYTLVVSPLLSLMQDQLLGLKRYGIYSSMLNQNSSKEEVTSIQNMMIDVKSPLKILFVTPEKLAKSKRFMARLEKSYASGMLQRIAIDEVHCCSQWGHDFRPDYKFLGILRRQFPENVPILGLTATATRAVIDDVKNILSVPAALTFKAPFNRPNLMYEVAHKPTNGDDFFDILLRLLNGRFKDKSGIIYCFSRKESEDVASKLSSNNIKALCYHADLDPQIRSKVHERWYSGACRVIVATVAFGMGIDKPDVRFVIHHSLAKSLENYYQESGRAGRDGDEAVCLLFYSFNDIFRQCSFVCTEKTGVDNLMAMVKFCHEKELCRRQILAKYFEETYDQQWCRQKCDNCLASLESSDMQPPNKKRRTFSNGSLKAAFSILANIINNAEQKLTGLKLADLLAKKTKMNRSDCETFIVQQLLDSYLKLDFHFTPYSIITYIVLGSRQYDSIDDIIID